MKVGCENTQANPTDDSYTIHHVLSVNVIAAFKNITEYIFEYSDSSAPYKFDRSDELCKKNYKIK